MKNKVQVPLWELLVILNVVALFGAGICAAMAEYGLLVALIAVVCIGAVTALGTALSGRLGEEAPPPPPRYASWHTYVIEGGDVEAIDEVVGSLRAAVESSTEVEVTIRIK